MEKFITCGHPNRPYYALNQCKLCYNQKYKKSSNEQLIKLTECEQAFVTYLISVCEDTQSLTPETILDTWWEAADDWVAAVKWGQANPDIKELRSNRKPNIRLAPKFLNSLEEN